MICPKCNNEIDNSSIFCPKCGAKLDETEEEKASRLRHERYFKILVLVLVGIIIVGTIGGFIYYNSLPSTKYARAEKAYGEENYHKAVELYTEAGDYLDSKIKLEQATVRYHYVNAKSYIEDKKYDEALVELGNTEGFEDTASLVNQCHYEKGILFKDKKDYISAADEFKASNSYSDADGKILEMANELAQNGDYEQALEIFGYSTESLVKKGNYYYYSSAMVNYNAGNYADAASSFKAAGDTLDSAEKYKECVYKVAKKDLDSKKYESAKSGFINIRGYEDADDCLLACNLMLAKKEMDAGKLNTAKTELSSLPEDYSYSGVSVSDLISKLSANEKWLSICGKWKSTGGEMRSTQMGSYYNYWWYREFDDGSETIEVKCILQSDGKVNVVISGAIPIYTTYSSIKAGLKTSTVNISTTETMSNFGTIKINDLTTVTIGKNSIKANYKKTDRSQDVYFTYVYKTDVTYGTRITTY